jgi:hypothetical protein
MAFDLLRIAIANAVKVANERVQKLLWNHFSGLPSELALEQDPTNGLKPMGRWCAALTAETRSLASPVTLDYADQVAEGMEDYASMAPLAVRRTHELVSLAHRVIAYELIIAAQAVDMRGRRPLGRGTTLAYETVREHVPMMRDAACWDPDVEALIAAVSAGEPGNRVAAGAGSRQELSEHQGPGSLPEAALSALDEASATTYGNAQLREGTGRVDGVPPPAWHGCDVGLTPAQGVLPPERCGTLGETAGGTTEDSKGPGRRRIPESGFGGCMAGDGVACGRPAAHLLREVEAPPARAPGITQRQSLADAA